jgi:cell division protein FtsQ
VGATAWAAFFSPLFAVRNVTVAGARHVTSGEIAEVAALGRSDNLLRLATPEVAKAAETLPWVRRATVHRILPGTIKVRIVERRPALVLSLGAARWIIDARGHVLAPAAKTNEKLPVLEAVQVANVRPGTHLHTPEVKAALRVFREMPRGLRHRVVALFAPSVERVTLSLDDGVAIRYGAPEQMAAKNAVLKALLARLWGEGRRPSYVDVRVPSSPAVSTAPASPGATPSP